MLTGSRLLLAREAVYKIVQCNIERVFPELNFTIEDAVLITTRASHSSFGDLAVPCFSFARPLKRSPKQIAETLVSGFQLQDPIIKVDARAGYLNIFLDTSAIFKAIASDTVNEHSLICGIHAGKRFVVEYSQPNTHKAFHVGHARCAVLGDSISRVLKLSGAEVHPVNYIGDEGVHVARCLWYLVNHYKGDVPRTNRGEFLGDIYARACRMVELSALSSLPHADVVVGRVVRLWADPDDSNLKWISVEIGRDLVSICTKMEGAECGAAVCCVRSGGEFDGKPVQSRVADGRISEGIVLSRSQVLGDDAAENVVYTFPKATELEPGARALEFFPIGDLLVGKIWDGYKCRNREVSELLGRLERKEPSLTDLWRKTRDWSLEEFRDVYKWLRCEFEHYFYESELADRANALIREQERLGRLVLSDGAIGSDLSKYNLGFCILIKSDGNVTYAARDLALAEIKRNTYGEFRGLFVVDEGQTLHFKQVFQTLELIEFLGVDSFEHFSYGPVVLADGKMSSRRGNVVLFSDLRFRLLKRIREEILIRDAPALSAEERESLAETIAFSAIRYGMLKQSRESEIVFDMESWCALSGNTALYLQYTYARIQTLVAKSKAALGSMNSVDCGENFVLEEEIERDVCRELWFYADAVADVESRFEFDRMCNYLFNLARAANAMYNSVRVLDCGDPCLMQSRSALLSTVGAVISSGLRFMGIPVVNRM